MKFLIFETNALSTLAEVNGAFKWENIGSTTSLVKLSDITIARGNQATGKTAYVIPIADEAKANEFATTAQQNGVTVQIVDEATAIAKKDELLAQVTTDENEVLKQRVADLELQVTTLEGRV